MFLPRRRGVSVPEYLARLRSAARPSRNRHSPGAKSSSFRKLRLRRLTGMAPPRPSSGRVAFDRAGHAPGTAAAPAELAARDGDDLDAVLAQVGVRGDVALVAEDDARLDGEEIVAVVP